MKHQNEVKEYATKVVDGRQVLTGAVWKWGPLLRQQDSQIQAKPVTRN